MNSVLSLDRRMFLRRGAVALLGTAFASAAHRLDGAASVAESVPLAPSPRYKCAGIQLIPVEGGKYRVWTKRVGSGTVKMLTLHGGPGATHEYLECFEDFLPQAGIEFYYYDQLGSAYSDQPDDASLWTLPRFVDEVETVRAALGLEDFYLWGGSSGAMMAIDYALKHPDHLRGLILSNMAASTASFNAYARRLRAALPPEVIALLDRHEAAGDFQHPEYQAAVFEHIYATYLCRLDPMPDPVQRAFKHLSTPVYTTMWGPNEFVVTGNLKDWDRWADLPKIIVPTLAIGAKYDEMDPEDIRREGSLLPRSRVAICENGSHLCMWDDQETYFRHLLGFVADVEAGKV